MEFFGRGPVFVFDITQLLLFAIGCGSVEYEEECAFYAWLAVATAAVLVAVDFACVCVCMRHDVA